VQAPAEVEVVDLEVVDDVDELVVFVVEDEVVEPLGGLGKKIISVLLVQLRGGGAGLPECP